jgi:hypothetical protein
MELQTHKVRGGTRKIWGLLVDADVVESRSQASRLCFSKVVQDENGDEVETDDEVFVSESSPVTITVGKNTHEFLAKSR